MPVEQPTFSAEELANEIWKDVVGYEGHYEVSDLGRVKSLKAQNPGKIMRTYMEKPNWYHTVSLCLDGVSKPFRAHVLVAAAFIGPCPEGHEVDHIDTDKTNSRASNLRYKTHAQNVQLAAEAGAFVQGDNHWSRREPERVNKGKKHHWSKASRAMRAQVRKDYCSGLFNAVSLGQKYNLSEVAVERILNSVI